MRIEAMLPGLASSEGNVSQDPHGEIRERAEEATRLLRELVPCAAYILSAWDPLTDTHIHRELGSDGYSQRLIQHINDRYVRDNPAFALLHTRVPHALRWRDLARDWNVNFSKTFTAEEFLIPEGFNEGTTACLRLRDGRYTGSLHISWSKACAATDERLEIIERFRPLLAMVCDLLRTPKILVDTFAPGAGAIVVSPDGMAAELPGRHTGSELADGSALRRLLAQPGATRHHRRFLWLGAGGTCHRITVIPCRDGGSLVTEEAIPWPYSLTPRELQILHLVTSGCSNPEIARRLYVSPRTVSTHVEHIFGKFGCSSRAELAATAVREGLLLGEDPQAEDVLRS